jgi:hypothetical protein
MSDLLLIRVLVFFSLVPFLKLIFFFQLLPSTLDLLRIKLHIFFGALIPVLWFRSRVWNVNSGWDLSFFFTSILFFNFILQHRVYRRLNFFIYFFGLSLYENNPTLWSRSWICHVNSGLVRTSSYIILFLCQNWSSLF